MDFYTIGTCQVKKKTIVKPFFEVRSSDDLMIRSKSFYAIWDEKRQLWSKNEFDVQAKVDSDLERYYESMGGRSDDEQTSVMWMKNFSSKSWTEYRSYVASMPDNYKQLDQRLTFSNTEVKKEDYISKRLPYPLQESSISSYEEIVSTLYDPEERAKIEWAIGAIVSGEARDIQKFLVFYGPPGSGKSTIMNIIEMLFEGYTATFDAKQLTSSSNAFSTEAFKDNPLVAIQQDGDLSRIEDNTRLNSIVAHELITINEKYKTSYATRLNCFLFMGTNQPVKITDSKSGIIRRLISVKPSLRQKIKQRRYKSLMNNIQFELGGIAYHCLKVFETMGKNYYDTYVPLDMMYATDPFFNFVEANYDEFCRNDGISLKRAYELYDTYCKLSGAATKKERYKFREELKSYFEKFELVTRVDGKQVRSYYSGFIKSKINPEADNNKFTVISPKANDPVPELPILPEWLQLKKQPSLFDKTFAEYPAQFANSLEKPTIEWASVTTKLKDIDTSKVHYVKNPAEFITVDFDFKGPDGKKSPEKNLQMAKNWPPTYAELSKGGGLHLLYLYTGGDPKELRNRYDDCIEIKVNYGGLSLRRKLTLCNDTPIAEISSGLPKEEKKMIDFEGVKNNKALHTIIENHLHKKSVDSTFQSMKLICKATKEAYDSGIEYDISDLRRKINAFAMKSSNHSTECIRMMNQIQWMSENFVQVPQDNSNQPYGFFDIDVFPNLRLVCWKIDGPEHDVVVMFNPEPQEIEELFKMKLIGYNNRKYDNHILFHRYLGNSIYSCYEQSKLIIGKNMDGFHSQAYDVSESDILDFASEKTSLKHYEVMFGFNHDELDMDWNKEVPRELWNTVADYCKNDVLATEFVFHTDKIQTDWTARKILADISGGSVNNTTNQLTAKLIFKDEKHPQAKFQYRNLAEPVFEIPEDMEEFLNQNFPSMMSERHGEKESILPYYDGYTFITGVSSYKGYTAGEGGFVWAKPGIYGRAKTYDVASMHPHSITSEYLLGPYTKNFNELMDARIAIKHKDFERAGEMFDGKLKPYLDDHKKAKQLSTALKIAINSVYGLTAAHFVNAFKDERNIDNIVAKRGALFMIDLLGEVIKRGGQVIHIKTDSIKILDPSDELEQFVFEFGKKYGYDFEIEHIFEKICLVNDAVYIAKLATDDPDWAEAYKESVEKKKDPPTRWTATGAQFAQPYVFKYLFSKEPITFEDKCEIKKVTATLYLDMNERLEEGQHDYVFVGKVGKFVPIKPGRNGAKLVREKDGKYSFATGTKDYRWLEAETVRVLDRQDDIDTSYHADLVNKALAAIAKFGDAQVFINGQPEEHECHGNCKDCEYYYNDPYTILCEKGLEIKKEVV